MQEKCQFGDLSGKSVKILRSPRFVILGVTIIAIVHTLAATGNEEKTEKATGMYDEIQFFLFGIF